MADAISVSGPVSGHRQDPDLLDRRARPAVPGRRRRQDRRHPGPRHRQRRRSTPARASTSSRSPSTSRRRCTPPGKIPGSFFRREGRPTDQAVLTCRLIDRPLRPSFADGYRNETQVVATIIGADQVNPHDVIAINGASAALMLSGLPVRRPDRRRAPGLQPGRRPGSRTRPTRRATSRPSRSSSPAAQVGDDDVAIMMVEAGGTEKAWSYYEAGAPKVTEAVIAERPRGLQGLDPRVHRPPERAGRQGRRARRPRLGEPARLRRRRRSPRVERYRRPAGRGEHHRRQDRAQRRQRRAQGRDPRRAHRRGQPVRRP